MTPIGYGHSILVNIIKSAKQAIFGKYGFGLRNIAQRSRCVVSNFNEKFRLIDTKQNDASSVIVWVRILTPPRVPLYLKKIHDVQRKQTHAIN